MKRIFKRSIAYYASCSFIHFAFYCITFFNCRFTSIQAAAFFTFMIDICSFSSANIHISIIVTI